MQNFTITVKAPSQASSQFKDPTSVFTFNPNSEGVPAPHLSEGGGLIQKNIGHLRVTVGHLRVTIGHLRVTLGHPRVTIGYL